MSISSILVANRGEIACRIIRTARELGLRTVAVYSGADRNAKHVELADEAVHIGSSPASESYLLVDRIIEAAKATGADAIHPGYGFLSENAAFAKTCAGAGLVFIGPPADAINIMGDKAKAKRAMLDAGVSCVPGYQDEDQGDATLIAAAEEIGLPVMVKAAAGGGGRGMRLVHKIDELADAIALARSEAENAFGSGALIIEKAITNARHVEIQIFADTHGNTIHLGERDCSVQRRHQKVIEEAPCPVMTPALRDAMGKAAIEAARAVNYSGAGTVEFLLGADGAFYFLEMNTRLQVEHPVTEAITGLDLVALQIAVANGDPLPLAQDEVVLIGHAIEARLYTEDPHSGFLPSTGEMTLWAPPTGPGIRVDDGIRTGDTISPFYDAMVAKIIAHGSTRDEARRRLVAALEETALFGLATNRDFLIDALNQPDFTNGEATTDFIAEIYGEAGFPTPEPSPEMLAIAACLDYVTRQDAATAATLGINEELTGWASAGPLTAFFDYRTGETDHGLTVSETGTGYCVTLGEDSFEIFFRAYAPPRAMLNINGQSQPVLFQDAIATFHLAAGSRSLTLNKLNVLAGAMDDDAGSGRVTAPMHGKLLSIGVASGDIVKAGDTLAILEAMKMQHEIPARIDGTVGDIHTGPNQQIAADDPILDINPPTGNPE